MTFPLHRLHAFLDHEKTRLILLVCGPLVALIGNAASDIWLVVFCIYGLLLAGLSRHTACLQQKWFIAAFLFWLWLLFTALMSPWPGNAIDDAASWIRFPLFAALLPLLLSHPERDLKTPFVFAVLSGVILMLIMLMIERIQDPDSLRLYGPWGQSPKPGWYLSTLGLFAALYAMEKAKLLRGHMWALYLLPVCVVLGSFATGEIYTTLSVLLGLVVYKLLTRSHLWQFGLAALICAILTGIMLFYHQDLLFRFTEQALTRLPWLPSSDYYEAWKGGLMAGLVNWPFGVGADNFDPYCLSMASSERWDTLGVKACHPHPHQLYLQIMAETGLTGLVLFITMIVFLFVTLFKRFQTKSKPVELAKPFCFISLPLALSLLIVGFWPVSTFSEAFGQHKNFFLWFIIALAVALPLSPTRAYEEKYS
jgi:O-antigen ligase